jgi:hypothetical protein
MRWRTPVGRVINKDELTVVVVVLAEVWILQAKGGIEVVTGSRDTDERCRFLAVRVKGMIR